MITTVSLCQMKMKDFDNETSISLLKVNSAFGLIDIGCDKLQVTFVLSLDINKYTKFLSNVRSNSVCS